MNNYMKKRKKFIRGILRRYMHILDNTGDTNGDLKW